MGNQGGSPLLGMVQKWSRFRDLGKIAKVQVWTNRQFGATRGAFPKTGSKCLNQKTLIGPHGLGPSEFKALYPSFAIPLDGEDGGNMAAGALGDVRVSFDRYSI